MSMPLATLTAETQDSIRAHYVTGHFALDEAVTRIRVGGMVDLTREHAAEVLRQPITPDRVKVFTGKDVTDEQIAARLAEVTA